MTKAAIDREALKAAHLQFRLGHAQGMLDAGAVPNRRDYEGEYNALAHAIVGDTGASAILTAASMHAEIERLRIEITDARFAPLGDNHHNALACPHCNPGRKAFA